MLTSKTGLVIFAVFFIFSIIATIIHEMSHLLVCELSSHDGTISLNILTGSITTCTGQPNPIILYHFIGGAMSSIVFTVPMLSSKIRKNIVIAIPCTTVAVTEASIAIFESVFNQIYLSDTILVYLISSMIPIVMIILLFNYKLKLNLT